MSAISKCLGQMISSTPGAGTAGTIYTAPGSAGTNYTVTSVVYVCNQGTTVATFRLWTAIHAAGDTAAQQFAFDMPIAPNETIAFRGICMDGTDLLRGQGSTTTITFVAYGEEN
jgi:hypothetical protein